ncbi:helix-turn-helix domain-containing protein [Actinoplanes sp. NPDC000266]
MSEEPAPFGALLNEETGDREALVSFLNELIRRWPWWDRTWRITEIHEVRVVRSHLTQFEARIGDVLIGPPVRPGDPHPFGAIFSALMDRRGISGKEMAHRCRLAESTVAKMRAGRAVPRERKRIADLAAALDMPVGDLAAIVGLPEDG